MRSVLNTILRDPKVAGEAFESSGRADIFATILHDRDAVAASMIADIDHPYVVALYGALHLDGIIAKLREANSRWRVESIELTYPFGKPWSW
jgi:hypothetical protein